MEEFGYAMAGVLIGIVGAALKDWWVQSRKNKKEVEYLSIQMACMLDRFVWACSEVVHDDGLFQGQYDNSGVRRPQVALPKFEPELAEVEWKSLPTNLMYQVLTFPNDIEVANSHIDGAFDYVATAPDYEEGFEERQYQYAILGIKASELASRLRKFSKLPEKVVGDWDPVKFMSEDKLKTDNLRKRRAEEHSKMLSNINEE